MSYFGDYQRKAIQSGVVDQEGDYNVKITETQESEIDDQKGKKKYVQVKCLVNHKNLPIISIFLTEGESFDGNFTAFCDTFGIKATDNPNTWIGKTGWIHINLKKKDGFTNMVPRWLLDETGFVRRDVASAAGFVQTQQPQKQQQSHFEYGMPPSNNVNDQFGDILF